jgi:hypothetical protein
LLRRGIANDAPRWAYMHDLGFVYYWWLHDYAAAAEWFDRAGDQVHAPSWLKPLAATTLARGGDRRSSRLLWTQIVETTDLDWLKAQATLRLAQLDAMDAIDRLNQASDRYAARTGHVAQGWEELIAGGGLRGVPLDPTGQPFEIDPVTGHATVSRRSTLWPLPDEAPATMSPLR